MLRNRNDKTAVDELIALFHSTGSVLLRHEVAYTMGQMQRIDAVPFLEGLLTDEAEDPITRHEAAEALGAIEAPESLDILARHAADAASEVSETCGLALAQLNYQIAKGVCGCERRPQEALRREGLVVDETEEEAAVCSRRPASPPPPPTTPIYTYVSPAPAAKAAPLSELRQRLLDRGQLCDAVKREEEHGMVRHEAAEALGAIGSQQAIDTLRQYSDHKVEILRESCWVALMWLD